MTIDEFCSRVNPRLHNWDLPRPREILMHPEDIDDLFRELWHLPKGPVEPIFAKGLANPDIKFYGIPCRPMDGVPRGAFAWKLTEASE